MPSLEEYLERHQALQKMQVFWAGYLVGCFLVSLVFGITGKFMGLMMMSMFFGIPFAIIGFILYLVQLDYSYKRKFLNVTLLFIFSMVVVFPSEMPRSFDDLHLGLLIPFYVLGVACMVWVFHDRVIEGKS